METVELLQAEALPLQAFVSYICLNCFRFICKEFRDPVWVIAQDDNCLQKCAGCSVVEKV